MATFVPGLQLSRQFYEEHVAPVLEARFAELPYSAALLGRGSEVLGFDDEMSTDHDWRPRVRAETWQDREEGLLAAYEKLAAMHNGLGVTEPVVTELVQMWDRPFRVAWADFPGLLRAEIRDPGVLAIAERWPFEPVDQLRDLLWPARHRRALLQLFGEP